MNMKLYLKFRQIFFTWVSTALSLYARRDSLLSVSSLHASANYFFQYKMAALLLYGKSAHVVYLTDS